MKKFLLAAVAAAALASPAAARDGAPYVGIEGGLMMAKDSDFDRKDFVTFGGAVVDDWVDWLDVDHGLGYDVDLIAGYDFGMFRLEGELGYKRAHHKEYVIDSQAPGPFPPGIVAGGSYDADGRTSITTGMINALVDFGDEEGISFYAGGGVGLGRISQTIDQLSDSKYHQKDNDLVWQILAGARMAISPNLDAGLKYRYFSAGTLKSDLYGHFTARSYVHSHSLLASLIYNFNAPPPPPPPPPAPERG